MSSLLKDQCCTSKKISLNFAKPTLLSEACASTVNVAPLSSPVVTVSDLSLCVALRLGSSAWLTSSFYRSSKFWKGIAFGYLVSTVTYDILCCWVICADDLIGTFVFDAFRWGETYFSQNFNFGFLYRFAWQCTFYDNLVGIDKREAFHKISGISNDDKLKNSTSSERWKTSA